MNFTPDPVPVGTKRVVNGRVFVKVALGRPGVTARWSEQHEDRPAAAKQQVASLAGA